MVDVMNDKIMPSLLAVVMLAVFADMGTQTWSRDASIDEAKARFQEVAAVVTEGEFTRFHNTSLSGLFQSDDILVVTKKDGEVCLDFKAPQNPENRMWGSPVACVPR